MKQSRDLGCKEVTFEWSGVPEAEADAFWNVLSDTWQQRIPAKAQRAIFDRFSEPKFAICQPVPGDEGLARSAYKGNIVWVATPVWRKLQDKPAWTPLLVGEELTHAALIAEADPSHAPDQPNEVKEAAVQKKMAKWGFDMAEHGKLMEWAKRLVNSGELLSLRVDAQPGN